MVSLFRRRTNRPDSYYDMSKYAPETNNRSLPQSPSSSGLAAATAALRMHSSPVSSSPVKQAPVQRHPEAPRSNSLTNRSNSLRQYTYHPKASYAVGQPSIPNPRRYSSLTNKVNSTYAQFAPPEDDEDMEETVVTTTTTKVVDSHGRTQSITTKTVTTLPDGSNIIETTTKNISRTSSRANSLNSGANLRVNSLTHSNNLEKIDEQLQNFEYDYQVDSSHLDSPDTMLKLNLPDNANQSTPKEILPVHSDELKPIAKTDSVEKPRSILKNSQRPPIEEPYNQPLNDVSPASPRSLSTPPNSITFNEKVKTIPVYTEHKTLRKASKPRPQSHVPPPSSPKTPVPDADFYAAAMQAAYKKVYGDRVPDAPVATAAPLTPHPPAVPATVDEVEPASPKKSKFGFLPLSPRRMSISKEKTNIPVPITIIPDHKHEGEIPDDYKYQGHHRQFATHSMRDNIAKKDTSRKERLKEEKRQAKEEAERQKRESKERAAQEKKEAKERAILEKKLKKEQEEENKRLVKEKAEEEKRLAEEEKILAKERFEEEKRLTKEKAEEEKRLAEEERRIAKEKAVEAKRLAKQQEEEERRIIKEKELEQKRIAKEKELEERRLAQERELEERRLAQEREIEDRRLAKEKEEEEIRIAKQRKHEEQKQLAIEKEREQIRLAKEKQAEEKRLTREQAEDESRLAREQSEERKQLAEQWSLAQEEKEDEENRLAQAEEPRLSDQDIEEEMPCAQEKADAEKHLAAENTSGEQPLATEILPDKIVSRENSTKELVGNSRTETHNQTSQPTTPKKRGSKIFNIFGRHKKSASTAGSHFSHRTISNPNNMESETIKLTEEASSLQKYELKDATPANHEVQSNRDTVDNPTIKSDNHEYVSGVSSFAEFVDVHITNDHDDASSIAESPAVMDEVKRQTTIDDVIAPEQNELEAPKLDSAKTHDTVSSTQETSRPFLTPAGTLDDVKLQPTNESQVENAIEHEDIGTLTKETTEEDVGDVSSPQLTEVEPPLEKTTPQVTAQPQQSSLADLQSPAEPKLKNEAPIASADDNSTPVSEQESTQGTHSTNATDHQDLNDTEVTTKKKKPIGKFRRTVYKYFVNNY